MPSLRRHLGDLISVYEELVESTARRFGVAGVNVLEIETDRDANVDVRDRLDIN